MCLYASYLIMVGILVGWNDGKTVTAVKILDQWRVQLTYRGSILPDITTSLPRWPASGCRSWYDIGLELLALNIYPNQFELCVAKCIPPPNQSKTWSESRYKFLRVISNPKLQIIVWICVGSYPKIDLYGKVDPPPPPGNIRNNTPV